MPVTVSVTTWPFVVFAAFWAITWLLTKKTVEKQKWSSVRVLYWIFGLTGVLLFFLSGLPIINMPLFKSSLASQSFGLLVEVLGLCFAIWARVTLGGNWSSAVTFKEKHELITRGPYGLVRHPIYTGVLAMFLGAAICLGALAGVLGVLFIFLSFLLKSRQEERLLTKHFQKEYANYKRTTKALIPFIY